MNPDTLLDYLDGKLPDHSRRDLETKLVSDPQLQRELEVARRIHTGMRASAIPEVPGEMSEADAARGRKLARRVGLAFLFLVAMNVGLGVLYIAHHETKKAASTSKEAEIRAQLQRSLESSTKSELTPAPLGIAKILLTTTPEHVGQLANDVAKLASRFGATATKGIRESDHLPVMVEIAGERAADFRSALANVPGIKTIDAATFPTQGKLTLLVQITGAK
ncbi:MAG: hypothetical protein M3R59_04475 [Verrucomicrobiota bacterium]|nr:hypothetical protein [Verrucomicrobiota bacterium]